MVAHRPATIRHADMILVLEAGKIVERGQHTQLLAKKGPMPNYAPCNLLLTQMVEWHWKPGIYALFAP